MKKLIAFLLIGGLVIGSVSAKSENESMHEAEDTDSSRLFENVINTVVECLRGHIEQGIPSLRIPPLDPLQIRIPIPLWFRKDFLRGYMILRKFKLEGLAGFELTKGSVSTSVLTTKLSLGFNFDKIQLTSKYRAKLTLFGFLDLYGKGTLSLVLKNFDVDSLVVAKSLPRLHISDLFLNVTLPETHAVITGLLKDEYMSDLISRQLSDTLTTLAEEENERFNTILHSTAMSFINTIVNPALKDLSIRDVFDIVKRMAGNCENSLATIVQTAAQLIMDAIGIDSDLVYSGDYSHFENVNL